VLALIRLRYIMTKRIEAGDPIIVVLHTPREKYWGILDEISTAGVFLRGLDLNSFDDWLGSILHEEQFIGLNDLFFPTWRIERINRDETSGAIPSLCEQVEKRTGLSVNALFGR
jgi:hypothetical protein